MRQLWCMQVPKRKAQMGSYSSGDEEDELDAELAGGGSASGQAGVKKQRAIAVTVSIASLSPEVIPSAGCHPADNVSVDEPSGQSKL